MKHVENILSWLLDVGLEMELFSLQIHPNFQPSYIIINNPLLTSRYIGMEMELFSLQIHSNFQSSYIIINNSLLASRYRPGDGTVLSPDPFQLPT